MDRYSPVITRPNHFDTSYFYHSVPGQGIKAGSLGIEDYFSHSVIEYRSIFERLRKGSAQAF